MTGVVAALAEALDELAASERQRGFELEQAPLLRRSWCVWTKSATTWSTPTTTSCWMAGAARSCSAVLARYTGEQAERTGGRYCDYITWLQAQDKRVSEAFWKEQLAELLEPARLAQAVAAEREQVGSGRSSSAACRRHRTARAEERSPSGTR